MPRRPHQQPDRTPAPPSSPRPPRRRRRHARRLKPADYFTPPSPINRKPMLPSPIIEPPYSSRIIDDGDSVSDLGPEGDRCARRVDGGDEWMRFLPDESFPRYLAAATGEDVAAGGDVDLEEEGEEEEGDLWLSAVPSTTPSRARQRAPRDLRSVRFSLPSLQDTAGWVPSGLPTTVRAGCDAMPLPHAWNYDFIPFRLPKDSNLESFTHIGYDGDDACFPAATPSCGDYGAGGMQSGGYRIRVKSMITVQEVFGDPVLERELDEMCWHPAEQEMEWEVDGKEEEDGMSNYNGLKELGTSLADEVLGDTEAHREETRAGFATPDTCGGGGGGGGGVVVVCHTEPPKRPRKRKNQFRDREEQKKLASQRLQETSSSTERMQKQGQAWGKRGREQSGGATQEQSSESLMSKATAIPSLSTPSTKKRAGSLLTEYRSAKKLRSTQNSRPEAATQAFRPEGKQYCLRHRQQISAQVAAANKMEGSAVGMVQAQRAPYRSAYARKAAARIAARYATRRREGAGG